MIVTEIGRFLRGGRLYLESRRSSKHHFNGHNVWTTGVHAEFGGLEILNTYAKLQWLWDRLLMVYRWYKVIQENRWRIQCMLCTVILPAVLPYFERNNDRMNLPGEA